MDIVFEKVPLEEYLAFFKTETDDSMERWIAIQHEFLLPPSWSGFNTYEIYCPSNISLIENNEFVIPTGFKCVSDFKQAICIPCFEVTKDIELSKEELKTHIVLRGIAKNNRCFQSGDRIIKLKFGA